MTAVRGTRWIATQARRMAPSGCARLTGQPLCGIASTTGLARTSFMAASRVRKSTAMVESATPARRRVVEPVLAETSAERGIAAAIGSSLVVIPTGRYVQADDDEQFRLTASRDSRRRLLRPGS